MSELDPNNQTGDNPWQVERLRITAFTSDIIEDEPSWWEELFGESPDNRTSRPKERYYNSEGAFGNGQLNLTLQLSRIDWVYSVKTDSIEGSLQALGLFPEVTGEFFAFLHRWIDMCSPVRRLAFGGVLFQPTANQEEGYKKLSGYLPTLELDPIGSSDFRYQINRPRNSKSGIENLKINRLSKWSVARQESQFLLVEIAGGKTVQTKDPGDILTSCRLEFDINTSQDFSDVLPKSELNSLLGEFQELAEEIAKQGDIP